MPRLTNGLTCDTCRTFVSYEDDDVIGWQVEGITSICPKCQKRKQEDEKPNS